MLDPEVQERIDILSSQYEENEELKEFVQSIINYHESNDFESLSEHILENIPIKWLPKIELYYPDLPLFPIVYVHVKHRGQRIYGFPVSQSFVYKGKNTCQIGSNA